MNSKLSFFSCHSQHVVSTSRSKMTGPSLAMVDMYCACIFPLRETQQCLPFAFRVSNGNVQYVFGIYRPGSEMGSELMGRNLHLRSMNSSFFPVADTVCSPKCPSSSSSCQQQEVQKGKWPLSQICYLPACLSDRFLPCDERMDF